MRAHLSKKVKAGRAAIVQDMVQAIKLLGRRPLQLIVDKLRGPKACSVGAQNNTGKCPRVGQKGAAASSGVFQVSTELDICVVSEASQALRAGGKQPCATRYASQAFQRSEQPMNENP